MSFFKKQSLSSSHFTQDLKINIYPNPATDFINIEADVEISKQVVFTIYNTAGKRVLLQNVKNSSFQHQINVSTLQPGVYFLQIEDESIKQSFKFIKN